MSDQKGRPLNADELSKVSDIVTDSVVAETRKREKLASQKQAPVNPPPVKVKKKDKRYGLSGILSVLFGGLWRIFKICMLIGVIIGSLFFAAYVLQQDELVRTQFEGKRWALPARVFARPLELYEGQSLSAENLQKELQLLGYSYVTHLVGTGQYTKKENSFQVQTRGFKFSEDEEIPRRIQIDLDKNKIIKLQNTESNESLTLMRLEPVLIGNFYPQHNEDRVLVRFSDVTPLLTKGLVAVEDKKYYQHFGVNPKSIVRALLANAEAGKKVQGASTLTQQLVKNFFLTSEKSYKRKAQEAIMSMLLEVHYDKEEILEAYLNEIYLGQNGKRAVHGFGLASQFYFNKPINELNTEQVALLIGLAKGPSVYNPRKHPQKALSRRNLVLDVMAREGVIESANLTALKATPLSVSVHAPPSVSPFPSYLELVRKQLQRDYQEKDLNSTGLLIFTSMDPVMQITAETVLQKRVEKLEKQKRLKKDKLNGAMIVSSVQGGEVLAVVGGRDARFAGYNRALNASRQIGSLIKPAVYLSALESGEYTLASPIDSGPVTVRISETKTWKPRNYEGKNLGVIALEQGLIKSLNTPTVRIGISLGLDHVIKTIQNLGVKRNIAPNPSLLLGALQLTPIEVQQMYQTFAAGGTHTPLKAIRSVMNSYGETLKSYPLTIKQVTKEESMYLVNYAMNKITKEGTARYLKSRLPEWKNSAGKTGTTNKNVDSWYAGFTGAHVVSVWVGRDDNKPSGLTGSSGALRVWSDFMESVETKPFKPLKPNSIKFLNVDKVSGLLFNANCGEGHTVPFLAGTEPGSLSPCAQIVESLPEDSDQPVWSSNSVNSTFSTFDNEGSGSNGSDSFIKESPDAQTDTPIKLNSIQTHKKLDAKKVIAKKTNKGIEKQSEDIKPFPILALQNTLSPVKRQLRNSVENNVVKNVAENKIKKSGVNTNKSVKKKLSTKKVAIKKTPNQKKRVKRSTSKKQEKRGAKAQIVEKVKPIKKTKVVKNTKVVKRKDRVSKNKKIAKKKAAQKSVKSIKIAKGKKTLRKKLSVTKKKVVKKRVSKKKITKKTVAKKKVIAKNKKQVTKTNKYLKKRVAVKKRKRVAKRKARSRNRVSYNSQTDRMNLSGSSVIIQNNQSYDSPGWNETIQ